MSPCLILRKASIVTRLRTTRWTYLQGQSQGIAEDTTTSREGWGRTTQSPYSQPHRSKEILLIQPVSFSLRKQWRAERQILNLNKPKLQGLTIISGKALDRFRGFWGQPTRRLISIQHKRIPPHDRSQLNRMNSKKVRMMALQAVLSSWLGNPRLENCAVQWTWKRLLLVATSTWSNWTC